MDKSECVSLSTSLHDSFQLFVFCGIAKVDTIADVLSDAAGEENGLLLHKCKLLLVVPRIVQVFDLLTREKQLAFNRVIEALN